MSPERRRRIAGWLLLISLVAWPVSALTWAKDEPPFILGLSFLAITLTCADIWATTDVRAQDEQ